MNHQWLELTQSGFLQLCHLEKWKHPCLSLFLHLLASQPGLRRYTTPTHLLHKDLSVWKFQHPPWGRAPRNLSLHSHRPAFSGRCWLTKFSHCAVFVLCFSSLSVTRDYLGNKHCSLESADASVVKLVFIVKKLWESSVNCVKGKESSISIPHQAFMLPRNLWKKP